MNFDLPPLDSADPPAFKTVAACNSWIAALPPDSPGQAHGQLLKQVGLLTRVQLDARERLAILDALWTPIKSVQNHHAQRFAAKPVPLDMAGKTAFKAVDALWHALYQSYLRAVADSLQSQATLAPALQRTFEILLQQQFDYARARQPLAPMHWSRLHELLALAEQHGATMIAVDDTARCGATQVTPLEPYAAAMLLQTAGPYGLRLPQLTWTERWARRWGSKFALLTVPPAELKAVPLCVDLASDQPASYRPAAGAGARFLDTAELRKSILSRQTLLDQNTPPEMLQLGNDCTQPECGALLKKLYQAWCQGGIPRRSERKPGVPGATLISNVASIFDELSGGMSLAAPVPLTNADIRKQRDAMAIFGLTRGLKFGVLEKTPNPHVERGWTVFDENVSGFRLERPLAQGGAPLTLGQLIALRPAGMKGFLLASVCSIEAGFEDKLQVGVILLPAPASAIAFKAVGLNAAKEPLQPGFLLPALAPTKEPPSVILPSGRFRAGRTVEFQDGVGHYRIRLTHLLERGEDYDRATFEQTAR